MMCLKVETVSNLFIKTSSIEASRVPDTQSVFIEHYLDEGINVNHTDLPQNTVSSFFLTHISHETLSKGKFLMFYE